MSEANDDRDLQRVQALTDRLQALAADAQARAAARRRRQHWTSLLGITLAIVSVFGMSALTRLGRKLDADAVAQLGRAELEDHLPASRAALERHLRAEAPRLVGESVHALVDVLPKVRRLVTDGLLAEMEALNTEFEDECLTWIDAEVIEARERIAEDYPHMGDREQLEMLVADFSANFAANFSVSLDALYPRYRVEMERLRLELVRLQRVDPASLDEDSRAKREIIETMLRLMLRAHTQPS